MDPRGLQDSQFAPTHLVYADGAFTIAFGMWENKHYSLAMRWDGDGDAPGFPMGRGGLPKWFVLQRGLDWPILCSLLTMSVPGANVAEISAALNVLSAERVGMLHKESLRDPINAAWQAILGKRVRVEPLYGDASQPVPDPWFTVEEVASSDVRLRKSSNDQYIRLPLAALGVPWGKETEGGIRVTVDRGTLRFATETNRWEWLPAKEFGYGERCSKCGKPIGPLHPAERVGIVHGGVTRESWRHVQPCPIPARVIPHTPVKGSAQ